MLILSHGEEDLEWRTRIAEVLPACLPSTDFKGTGILSPSPLIGIDPVQTPNKSGPAIDEVR
jgi:hypothetical protein